MQIQRAVVLGASGNVGKATVEALLNEQFLVTAVTRESTTATFPESVTHIKSDYSEASLSKIFEGQDAVVSTLSSIAPGGTLALQKSFIDVAIKAGVKMFFPSEFGVDTSSATAPTIIPFLKDKAETLQYLQEREDSISWVSVICGSLFDWGLNIPGFGGWDLAARTVTLFDGGDIAYEATTVPQVGRAIAKCLRHPELVRNQYVYVNSFTLTQKSVLAALERLSGDKFEVSHSTVAKLWEDGATQVQNGQPFGAVAMIAAAVYGNGGLANYSAKQGLWNKKIALSGEDLDDVLKPYLTK